MKCPADQTEMQKQTYEGTVETDYCTTCNGMWLDAGELEKIQEVNVNDYTDELKRIPDYVGKSMLMAQPADRPELKCPQCDAPLERREYGYCSQIYIDSCINGHGVWLDKGELRELEIFYERSRRDVSKGFLKSLLSLFGR